MAQESDCGKDRHQYDRRANAPGEGHEYGQRTGCGGELVDPRDVEQPDLDDHQRHEPDREELVAEAAGEICDLPWHA